MLCFLDCEFTGLIQPELLSLGLTTLDGREHYVELDLASDIGQARKTASSDFVRYGGVLDMWGRVPDATVTEWEMGRRTGEWLLGLAAESGSRVEVAFGYPMDFELMEYAIRDSGLWDRVREVVWPVNVDKFTGTVVGELAAEQSFRQSSRRGLSRHHALADALALRRAYMAVAVEPSRRTEAPAMSADAPAPQAPLGQIVQAPLGQSGELGEGVGATPKIEGLAGAANSEKPQ